MVSFSSCNINEGLLDRNIQEEIGYDFQGCHLNTSSNIDIDGGSQQLDNNSNNKQPTLDGLSRFSILEAATAIKVDSFGAKGDGTHDDTTVSKYIVVNEFSIKIQIDTSTNYIPVLHIIFMYKK